MFLRKFRYLSFSNKEFPEMSFETVEEAIVYVLKKQKSYIQAEADAARARGDT